MLVSVIVPCFNQDTYLNEALDSVYKQTYSNWECLIIDDGSTDDTSVIAKNWVNKDNRFKYFFQENNGVSSARNLGIKKAKGEYLQFLDSDDLLHKNKISESLNQIKNKGKDDQEIVVTNFKMLSPDSKKILPPFCTLKEEFFTLEGFLFKWNIDFSIQIQCGFFSSSLFNKIKFPENLSAQEDWLVWIQLMKAKEKLTFINKTLAYYRVNPKSRMRTLGVGDNQIKMLDNFQSILTFEEYYMFSTHLIGLLYNKNIDLKSNIKRIKSSNTFQFSLMLKKIAKMFYLTRLFKSIFKFFLKFKK